MLALSCLYLACAPSTNMSTFGTIFRVTTFGESHCKGVGAIVDGVPPRMCALAQQTKSFPRIEPPSLTAGVRH